MGISKATSLELPSLNSGYARNLPSISPATIDSYMAYVNTIPILTENEEFDYAKKLHQQGNLQAAHCLVMAHLRYVVKIAKNYLGYGLPLADLIQEGTIGLMKAVSKFDYSKKVRLVTFAMHWIKAEIHEFILKNWKIVKIATTKAQRKLFFKLRSNKKDFNWLNKKEVQRISSELKVKPKEVKQMELRIFSNDDSFDEPAGNLLDNSSEKELALAPVNYLEDFKFNPEIALENKQKNVLIGKLHKAIARLSPRHQDILKRRWLQEDDKSKLQDLAIEYGISKERIRQIENQAIVELREELSECF